MKISTILAMGLLSFLIGCGSKTGKYNKKDGEWHYKKISLHESSSEPLTFLGAGFAKTKKWAYWEGWSVAGADVPSFVGLSDHYAKDKDHAFWLDTYRDSKEYWSIQHLKSIKMDVDVASFHNLDERHAKDNKSMYYEGVAFAVADVATYTILEPGYAKDKVHGYYARRPIMESDGLTFATISGDFSKDATHVFYSGGMTPDEKQGSPGNAYVLKDANPATFTLLESNYANDSGRVYYAGKLLETEATSFRVLQYDYGVSGSHVYYRGVLLKGADPATFEIVALVDSGPTAKDKNNTYSFDKRLKK